jgi:OHCU decarboxylase
MAISKVALAGCALIDQGTVREIRLAAASVAAYPTRLYRTEEALCGKALGLETIRAARAAAVAEIVPIDDIRSTAEYRRIVTVNLLREFLGSLTAQRGDMTLPLARWNDADSGSALDAMIACCGSRRWANAMIAHRPIPDESKLHDIADRTWETMKEADWMEAFACHPRIGERKGSHALSQSSTWSEQEQSPVSTAADTTLSQLAEGNARYEEKFGFIYIVCATGKSPEEMLSILSRRLSVDRASELREAAEQQRQIMHIRLRKWLDQ